MADRTVVYRIQADVKQAQAQVAALGASVKKSAGDMTAATKEGAAFRGGLDSLGNTAGKIGLVAAAGLGAAVLKAADFDQAMSNIKAATHESADAMDDLRAAALKAGADTAFSATEAASGIEELAKAGVSTANILGGGLSGALDLAAAGGLGVAEAAETAATALTQFQLQGEDVPHVADLLAAAAGKAQGSVSDMGMALKQSGLVAAQTGLTIEETTGTLAAFASAGLIGSDAGTSFKTMLQSLTPSSDRARDAMDAMGFSAYDAQGNFKGMETVAGDLRAGLSTMSQEQQNATLKTIFGSDAVRAAAVIYEQGAEGIGGWIDKTNDAGYAAETAAIKLDNLKGDLEALGGSLETALIGTGDGAQTPLRSLTQSLTDVVNGYNELGSGAKSGVAITLGATAALGGGLFVFSKMVQSIAATRAAMTALGVTAQSTGAMVATAATGMGVALAAGLAVAAGDLFDVDYSLDSINRQLELLATQGDADGVLEGLSMSADTLGEALRDAAYNDFNMFGMGAAAEIEELDAALSGLDPSTAAETFKVLVEEGTKAGLTTAEVAKLFPKYAAELKLTAAEADAAGGALETTAEANTRVAQTAQLSAAAIEAQEKALQDARKAAHETAAGFVNLGDGVDDAKVSLGQWIQQMAKQTDALNNFMNNAKAASKRGLRDGLINDLQDAGTAGALRMKQLSNATDEEIAKANRAWKRGQDAMQAYVDFKVPPKKPEVDFSGALSSIQIIRRALTDIPDENVVVRVTRSGTGAVSPGFGPQAKAGGGGIHGPGTGTSDEVPIWASNGEHMWTAREVANAGGHSAMESMRSQFRFATGGAVGGAGATGTPAERLELLEAIRAVRQLQRELAKDGKDSLKGMDRRIAQTQLIIAKGELRGIKAGPGPSTDALTKAIEDLEATSKTQTEALDEATKVTEGWASKMDDVAQATTSGFNTGLFDRDSNVWGAGSGGGPLANLNRDIAGLNERATLQTQLSGMGISGDALAALLGEGSNADISGLIASGQVGQFVALFNQRAALQGSVGAAGGQAAYGADYAAALAVQEVAAAAAQQTVAQLAALTATNARMEAQIARLNETGPERTGAAVGGVINGAAASAQRDRTSRGGR